MVRDLAVELLLVINRRLCDSIRCQQRIHLSLHALGFVSAVVGVIAVFRFHNEHSITNLYSLHSWLGLLSLILFSGHVRRCFGYA